MTTELRRRIATAEAELQALRDELALAEAEEAEAEAQTNNDKDQPAWPWPLPAADYDRYARQLILPAVGVRGQQALRTASVVVVGAGGLGCPAAMYLAGAGVGRLLLVDGDTVEASNLHRQIGHTTGRVGQPKVDSLAATLRQINPTVDVATRREHMTPANASAIVGPGTTLVLDCTDHPAVRYLVSDACVRAGVPLVSAAALRTDGQLVVLNHPPGRGPCYRCVFPRAPPPASQTSCAEGGVLGPVVGALGVLQALEAVRVLVSVPSDRSVEPVEPLEPSTMLLFSASSGRALASPTCRTVRLKGRRRDCFACGDDAPLKRTVKTTKTTTGLADDQDWPDYVRFCGSSTSTSTSTDDVLPSSARVSVQHLAQTDADARWLLDVREKELFDMGTIRGAINVPFSATQVHVSGTASGTAPGTVPNWLPTGLADDDAPVYVVCRVGNDSQAVARHLQSLGLGRNGARFVGDVEGGLRAWKQHVDPTIPFV